MRLLILEQIYTVSIYFQIYAGLKFKNSLQWTNDSLTVNWIIPKLRRGRVSLKGALPLLSTHCPFKCKLQGLK